MGEVSQRLRELQEHWEKLRQAVALWGKDLEDKRNILEFLQRVDAAEAWMEEMVRPCWAGTELAVGQWRWQMEEGGPGRKFPKSPPAPALPLAAGCLGARCSQDWVPRVQPSQPMAPTGGDGECQRPGPGP